MDLYLVGHVVEFPPDNTMTCCCTGNSFVHFEQLQVAPSPSPQSGWGMGGPFGAPSSPVSWLPTYPTAWPLERGNQLTPLRGRDRSLQLFSVNQEFPVSASHKLALITSLPFVHTARRYYRLNVLVRYLDWAFGGFDLQCCSGRLPNLSV